MWKFKPFPRYLEQIIGQDCIGEVILIDNDIEARPKDFFSHPKIKLLEQEENIYVNPAWNLGAKIAQYSNLCFLSDDVIADGRIYFEVDSFLNTHKDAELLVTLIGHEPHSQPHRTIKTTPNEMYNDINKQIFNFEKDKEYNRNVLDKNKISIGAEARILETKDKLEKGSQKFSLDVYKLVGREGNRFMVENAEGEKLRRRLKPAELQVVKTVDSKIDRNIIKEQAAEKKQRQVINKLIRGSEMKKEEALKALESLKTPEEKIKRSNRTERDYAAMMLKKYRTPATKI